jgi:hypothetical protein
MLIDGGRVPRLMVASGSASSSKQGLDDFVAQHQQRSQCTHPVRSGLVTPRVFDFANQLLGSELLQVVGGATRCIFPLASGLYLGGESRSAKSPGRSGQGHHRLGHGSHPSLVHIDSPNACLSHPSRLRQLFQGLVGNEAEVHPGKHLDEPFQQLPETSHDAREADQFSTAPQFSRVMHERDMDFFGSSQWGALQEWPLL